MVIIKERKCTVGKVWRKFFTSKNHSYLFTTLNMSTLDPSLKDFLPPSDNRELMKTTKATAAKKRDRPVSTEPKRQLKKKKDEMPMTFCNRISFCNFMQHLLYQFLLHRVLQQFLQHQYQ